MQVIRNWSANTFSNDIHKFDDNIKRTTVNNDLFFSSQKFISKMINLKWKCTVNNQNIKTVILCDVDKTICLRTIFCLKTILNYLAHSASNLCNNFKFTTKKRALGVNVITWLTDLFSLNIKSANCWIWQWLYFKLLIKVHPKVFSLCKDESSDEESTNAVRLSSRAISRYIVICMQFLIMVTGSNTCSLSILSLFGFILRISKLKKKQDNISDIILIDYKSRLTCL